VAVVRVRVCAGSGFGVGPVGNPAAMRARRRPKRFYRTGLVTVAWAGIYSGTPAMMPNSPRIARHPSAPRHKTASILQLWW